MNALVDVVEIDPIVVKFAKDYFGFQANGGTFVEDAKNFVVRESNVKKDSYDAVIHDIFRGRSINCTIQNFKVLHRPI